MKGERFCSSILIDTKKFRQMHEMLNEWIIVSHSYINKYLNLVEIKKMKNSDINSEKNKMCVYECELTVIVEWLSKWTIFHKTRTDHKNMSVNIVQLLQLSFLSNGEQKKSSSNFLPLCSMTERNKWKKSISPIHGKMCPKRVEHHSRLKLKWPVISTNESPNLYCVFSFRCLLLFRWAF